MRGQVLYPDGTPAVGATVVAQTTCPEDSIHIVDEVTTTEDGSFFIPSFDPRCSLVRFTAEHRAQFWLRTGDDVFYPSTNGTTPEVDISSGPPPPVTILLDARGGEVEFQVWDEATGRLIYAGLEIERVDWKDFASIWTATGKDGSSATLFLPGGQYRVSILRFPCRTRTYFTSIRVWKPFEVSAGQRILEKLTVDVRNMEASSSYDNPSGEKCQP